MQEYLKLSHELAKKQMIQKIKLEIIYDFLILDKKETDIPIIDDINIFTDTEYLSLIDIAIKDINEKTKLNLNYNNKKIKIGKSN